MARDYGYKKQPSKHSSAPRQLGWLVAAFLGGYLTATVFDFTSLSAWLNNSLLNEEAPSSHLAVNHKKAPATKPKFEFYTLLSKDAASRRPATAQVQAPAPVAKVQLPVPTITSKATPAPTAVVTANPATPVTAHAVVSTPAVQTVTKHERYDIQLAALKTRQDAEKMKASLILKGFSVSITQPSASNGPWFRVFVGPFASHELALNAQRQLSKTEHINGMIRNSST